MSLAVLGFLLVGAFMTLIMAGRVAPVVALILTPVAFALAAGHGADVGTMMLEGVRKIAPTGVMIMFAILYFGLMIDAGLFDPPVRALLKAVRGDPARVVASTLILAALVSLDGDGSTTYMVTAAALLPLYGRLGLNPLIMTALTMLASGVMNLVPWGGPTARAAAALQLDVDLLFRPMILPMLAALAFLLALAWGYGLRERRRLGIVRLEVDAAPFSVSSDPAAVRPRRLWVNAALTLTLLAGLVTGAAPLPALFMGGFALAALINYPRLEDLRTRMTAHASNVIGMTAVIFAAGAFTGVLTGTGMAEAMPKALVAAIPPAFGPHMAAITGVLSVPLTFLVSNDAFYFGVVPVLAQAGAPFGVTPAQIGAASLVGQPFHLLSPLVPSTYLLVSLAGVELAAHQRFTWLWALATCGVLLLAGAAFGAFPLRG